MIDATSWGDSPQEENVPKVKKLSFNLTTSQYEELKAYADENNMTVSDVIVSCLPITKTNRLTMDEILQRVEHVSQGTRFTIPELFSSDEWESFDKGSKLATGKLFFQDVSSRVDGSVIFISKASNNLAEYEKL